MDLESTRNKLVRNTILSCIKGSWWHSETYTKNVYEQWLGLSTYAYVSVCLCLCVSVCAVLFIHVYVRIHILPTTQQTLLFDQSSSKRECFCIVRLVPLVNNWTITYCWDEVISNTFHLIYNTYTLYYIDTYTLYIYMYIYPLYTIHIPST